MPFSQDYDGDGLDDPTYINTYDLTSNYPLVWNVIGSSLGNFTIQPMSTGSSSSDHAIKGGDFDGDGKADAALRRGGSTLKIFIRKSTTNTNKEVSFTERHVFADFDGDNITDIAETSYHPGNLGVLDWTITNSSDNSVTVIQEYGFSDPAYDTPIVGYFDGDNLADIAVRRNAGFFGCPSNTKCYYWLGTSSGASSTQWGYNTDEDYFRQYGF